MFAVQNESKIYFERLVGLAEWFFIRNEKLLADGQEELRPLHATLGEG